tara:strand:- start:102 stop:1262 length:1161 start_codon:yes stop_codon:yes gene_type:complete
MSEFDLEEITDRAGTGAPNFTHGFNINGSDSGLTIFTHTVGATEPSNPSNGDTWWNTDNDSYNVYVDGEWKGWLGDTYSSTSHYGDRGHKAGVSHTNTDRIEYWNMTSAGNAADFGNLTTGGYAKQGMVSDGSRIYMPLYRDTTQIDYWTSSTLGNASDYGDLQYGTFDSDCGSDGSKALLVHGYARSGGSNYVDGIGNKIEQFTIGTGNAGVTATDFGNQLLSGAFECECASNGTRMIMGGGFRSGVEDTIAYVTFATAGNAVDAGDLNVGRYSHAAAGGGAGDIACYAGGNYNNAGGYTNSIDQKNITNTNNATDFGDLTTTPYVFSGCYNATKGHYVGGYDTASNGASNVIQQITFATSGNATDFGDLLESGWNNSASSGAAS